MTLTRKAALALAAALAGATAAAQGAGPGIALTFAWPERLEGRRTEARDGRSPADGAPRRTPVRIERRGAEAWLLALPAEGEGEGAPGADAAPELPLVAGADGRFLRLDGLDALAEEEAAFQVKFAATRAEAAAARKAAAARVARIAEAAREHWIYQVEAWAGRVLEPGRVLEAMARVPIAAVPGLEVEQRVTLSARKWVSCVPGGLDRRCLELALKAQAGPDAFRKGLAASGRKGAAGFEDGSLTVEVVLVTDPATLVPRRYAFTRRLKLVFEGRGLSVDQEERRELQYEWW